MDRSMTVSVTACICANHASSKRRIHTLFDDENPADEQVFGRVARDDFSASRN